VDFPGDPVVGSVPANAGNMGLIPGLGGFHMLQDNEAHAPELLKPTNPGFATREATTLQLDGNPCMLQSLWEAMKTQWKEIAKEAERESPERWAKPGKSTIF